MALSSARFSFRGVLISCLIAIVPGMAFSQPTVGLAHDFEEAERLFWLDNWVKARNLYADCEVGFARSDPAKALICKFSRLRADAETNLSYYTVSKLIATDL